MAYRSTKAFQAALKRIETERERWDLVAISAEILQSAERLTVDFNIRSLDAIHLASTCGAAEWITFMAIVSPYVGFLTVGLARWSAANPDPSGRLTVRHRPVCSRGNSVLMIFVVLYWVVQGEQRSVQLIEQFALDHPKSMFCHGRV